MTKGLPHGWAVSTIEGVANIKMGKTVLSKDLTPSGLPVYSAGAEDKPWGYLDGHAATGERGTIVLSARGSIGFPKLPKHPKFISTQTTISVTPSNAALPEFLLLALKRLDYHELSSGAAIPMLTVGKLNPIEIPVPPLPEQQRIVRKLDTLTARSTTARTHLTAIKKLVERYRTSVLEAAFVEAWDAGCNTTIAGCLEHSETGLVRSKAEQTADEGYPYIRMNHYDLSGRWNDRDLTYVTATSSEFERYQLRANDLLFNTRNSAELVGKVAIWPEGKDDYLFNNNLLRMRFSADVVPAFAFWQMSSRPFRRYIEGFISATTSVAAIYQRSLMAAPFWVPKTDEQREIVRRIETAFAKIDGLAVEAAKALKLVGHLDQRILAKAFAGELVPQDPSDEPAETLLARIREARETAPKAKRKRRTSA